jgi:hypothetical protein
MIYNYNGVMGCCRCDIEVYGNVVIATELKDNIGVSITSCAEDLANEICKKYEINLDRLIWIECYSKANGFPKEVDLVKFSIVHGSLCNPEWIKISQGKVDKILQENKVERWI